MESVSTTYVYWGRAGHYVMVIILSTNKDQLCLTHNEILAVYDHTHAHRETEREKSGDT